MTSQTTEPVDLGCQDGKGPVWGIASEDLNATLLSWGPGDEVAEHINAERDVLIVVTKGSGLAIIDGQQRPLHAHHALLIPKGSRRQILAGHDGLHYLSVHLRREPLQIQPTT